MENSHLEETDLYLFHQGTDCRSYRLLGAHFTGIDTDGAVRFAVWAPEAKEVRLAGDFNGWRGKGFSLKKVSESGVWAAVFPGIQDGALYKYEVVAQSGRILERTDPFGFFSEVRPNNASVVFSLAGFHWHDENWMTSRGERSPYRRPLNVYEVHAGSWRRHSDGSFFNFRELADTLLDYVLDMGYTHIELMPVMEHALDGSWGYQVTGYFAVTSRYGTPFDFMYFVDRCHQKGIGVILDWVPGHFCRNDQCLGLFDGSHIYEPLDTLRRDNSGWGTYNFDYGRPEVRSFLLSNALFWFDIFHVDGLRTDAVASMIYLDYGKKTGEYKTNILGGRENLEALDLLKKANEAVFANFPNALMIAEESSTWPLVTRPTDKGGLGFNYKWNMGWMNDCLKYMEMDYNRRRQQHNLLTFSMMYAYSENFILALSHDEVVHGKKSLLDKMPGDYWRKFANLRTLFGFLTAHPGKKTIFMGAEIGQFTEWNENRELDWVILDYPMHRMLQDYVRDLNHFYLEKEALWDWDHDHRGFRWIDPNNREQCIYSFIRCSEKENFLIALFNFSLEVYHDFRLGVPEEAVYREVLNSDQKKYGGSGVINPEPIAAEQIPWHGQDASIVMTIPPLACIFLEAGMQKDREGKRK